MDADLAYSRAFWDGAAVDELATDLRHAVISARSTAIRMRLRAFHREALMQTQATG